MEKKNTSFSESQWMNDSEYNEIKSRHFDIRFLMITLFIE